MAAVGLLFLCGVLLVLLYKPFKQGQITKTAASTCDGKVIYVVTTPTATQLPPTGAKVATPSVTLKSDIFKTVSVTPTPTKLPVSPTKKVCQC